MTKEEYEQSILEWGTKYKALYERTAILVDTLEAVKLTIDNTLKELKASGYEKSDSK